MTVALIKSNDPDNLDLPDNVNAWGMIRLWIEGTPPTPTLWWVIIGEFALSDSARLLRPKMADLNAVNVRRDAIFARLKRQVTDFGFDKGKSFRVDVRVPASLIPA